MTTITKYLAEAELALAAYATLPPDISGTSYIKALQDDGDGMSFAQAKLFASTYSVVDQYNDLNGLSATVFQKGTTKYLAIRGTDGPMDILADFHILEGLPSQLTPQYLSLKTKVQEWLDNDVLSSNFTVTDHSLGGYLAAGLLADFNDDISHAYLYNAPRGNSSIALIMEALGVLKEGE